MKRSLTEWSSNKKISYRRRMELGHYRMKRDSYWLGNGPAEPIVQGPARGGRDRMVWTA